MEESGTIIFLTGWSSSLPCLITSVCDVFVFQFPCWPTWGSDIPRCKLNSTKGRCLTCPSPDLDLGFWEQPWPHGKMVFNGFRYWGICFPAHRDVCWFLSSWTYALWDANSYYYCIDTWKNVVFVKYCTVLLCFLLLTSFEYKVCCKGCCVRTAHHKSDFIFCFLQNPGFLFSVAGIAVVL